MPKRLCIFFLISFIVVLSVGNGWSAEHFKLPVLMYHHIMPEADMKYYVHNGLVISSELFGEQMAYLYENGYHTVTAEELHDFLYDKKALPSKSVMLTFDDGYISNYLFVYPILKQYGFHAVLFLITGAIENTDQDYHTDKLDMLSWLQVAASTDVFAFASHTHVLHHAENGKTGFITAPLPDAEADLRESLRHVPNQTIFAYPQGQYNQQLVDMLRKNGVEMAVTTQKGYVRQDSDPYTLNRIPVFPNCKLENFQKILRGQYQ